LSDVLAAGGLHALIDVREHGEYNLAHIPGSSSVPRRLLEHTLGRLVPHPDVMLVVCDDDGRRARLAAATASSMGYRDVRVLAGGVNGWASVGLPTEWGMNVPSKDFGERVEVEHDVPTIHADELHAWQADGQDLLILDTRTPEEYARFTIPGSRSMPGAELALRIDALLAERPNARVVVNCAGRTRSIIGARTLQRMGVQGAVSLRNGTSGWVLAGHQLEQGAQRLDLPAVSEESLARADAYARRVAAEDGVRVLDARALQSVLDGVDSTCTYLLDVRTEPEFAAGHIPGFWWFPGGQAVQRADDAVAVRGATIVFCCDGAARSHVTASWYRQLGFPNVCAVDGGTAAWIAAGGRLAQGRDRSMPPIITDALSRAQRVGPEDMADAATIFVGTSREFAAGHIPGSRWIPRGWLEFRIGELVQGLDDRIVVAECSETDACLAAEQLRHLGYANVRVLGGGVAAWERSGRPLERGLAGVMAPPDDLVPAGPERTSADMINYLRWEERLGHKYAPLDAAHPA
jgi:rhodanese-related sulfurtransferase